MLWVPSRHSAAQAFAQGMPATSGRILATE